jgi:hypothetical protein
MAARAVHDGREILAALDRRFTARANGGEAGGHGNDDGD